jgi:hypothetical protein
MDHVVLSNTSGNENGILVTGNASPPAIYQSSVGATTTFAVGPLWHSAGNNEVVAFTNERAVAIQPSVPWTNGSDTVKAALTGPIAIDVTVWVVRGVFASQQARAIALKIATVSIWDQERMGVTFGAFDIQDQTMNHAASLYSDFDCTKKYALQTAIGKTAGRINIYMVNTVQGNLGRGQACGIGSDFVAIGSSVGDALLSHEIGHDFGLEHIDTVADFDDTNVMHSASNVRQYFTEGQLFRAHLQPLSAVNNVYHARGAAITRNCPMATSNDTCPAIDKRIWADGTFPPN